ncbi:hypothetical protein JG688_00014556 [Phytophthora aleatoria]|uniref:Uncharacterized protein n=1 Tax=Phytophthora aleatoria TaxID=2496075 RepID=A0A8J5MDE0_9STRA|nr:hypothetical protein JG688_00014556 [Phytophthora aleatoria]
MSTISRQPRRNHEVRAILCCKYIYMKTGSMSGTVPECVYCGELNYAHEAKQIIQMLSYIAFTRAPVYIDFARVIMFVYLSRSSQVYGAVSTSAEARRKGSE